MTDHILHRFDKDLEDLNTHMERMFKLVRKNIKQAMEALFSGDIALAESTIEQDKAVNALEVEVDEMARQLIVIHQPVASDLRFVFAALKIVTDLERMGDLAASIAQNVKQLGGQVPQEDFQLPLMKELVIEQLKAARNAYRERDPVKAQAVIERDRTIDEIHAANQRIMLTYMAENPSLISHCMAVANIAKVIERIGDHVTNVAEMVIYVARGHEVRHTDPGRILELLEGEDDD